MKTIIKVTQGDVHIHNQPDRQTTEHTAGRHRRELLSTLKALIEDATLDHANGCNRKGNVPCPVCIGIANATAVVTRITKELTKPT